MLLSRFLSRGLSIASRRPLSVASQYVFSRKLHSGSRSSESSTSFPSSDIVPAQDTLADSLAQLSSAVSTPEVITSLDAAWYSPVGYASQALIHMHSVYGLHWIGAIAGTTIAIRLCLSPVALLQMKNMGAMMMCKPEIDILKVELEKCGSDIVRKAALEKQMYAVFEKSGFKPMMVFAMVIVNMPVFLTFFMTLRRMAEEIPDLKTGGMYWFTDLSLADPYYILPLLTGATFFLTIEIGAETGMPAKGQAMMGRWLMRGLAVAMIPITASFPAALLVYWLTNNMFSLVQAFLFRRPFIRRLVGLPDLKVLAELARKSQVGSDASQTSWQSMLGRAPPAPPKPVVFIPDTTFSTPPIVAQKKKLAFPQKKTPSN